MEHQKQIDFVRIKTEKLRIEDENMEGRGAEWAQAKGFCQTYGVQVLESNFLRDTDFNGKLVTIKLDHHFRCITIMHPRTTLIQVILRGIKNVVSDGDDAIIVHGLEDNTVIMRLESPNHRAALLRELQEFIGN